MKTKCSYCGTVNWADAEACVRCKISLNPLVAAGSACRVEYSPTDALSSGVKIFGGLLAVVVIIGVCGYMFWTSEPDVKPTTTSANSPPANRALDAALNLRRAEERIKAEIPVNATKLMKNAEPWTGWRVPQENPKNFPYVPPGGFGPPGAGVPYRTR